MQKIITLFQQNYETDRLVRDEIVPGAEWVHEGEGIATRKYDGTCAMVRDGKLYKRYDLKSKKGRHSPPKDWEPAQPEPDPITSSWPGWVPIGEGPDDRYFREAWENLIASTAYRGIHPTDIPTGTYELVGPKVQGNPEGFRNHILLLHGTTILDRTPRDFFGLRDWLESHDVEGIVWHHPDGRMVKIKKRDFGLKRK